MDKPLITVRKLKFKRRGQHDEREIVLGISAPYDVPSPTGETFIGCVCLLGSEESRHEVYGIDGLTALGTALSSIDTYLASMEAAGELHWPDGRKYEHDRQGALWGAKVLKEVGDLVTKRLTES